MSVPSSNTTVTTETPYLEIDRISSTRGIPAMARSTAVLTYCSTSTGDSAGATVMIWTWTFVTSGTASIGSSIAERTPTNTSSAAPTRTIARCRSDQPTIRVRIHTSLLLAAEGALQDRALQREDAVDNDLLAGAQAAENLDASPRRPADGDGVQLEVSVGVPHEHDIPVRDLGDRRQRNDHVLGRRLRV